MQNTKEVVACVCDHGLFLPVARRLAREFKKVYYWSPHERSFPTVRDQVGDGFDDVERVDSIWDIKDKCDLFVFPDIGFASLQKELISQGFPVWGARDGDSLEILRGKFLQTLQNETDLPVPKFKRVVGLSALREHLEPLEDRYIKISRFRGDWETFHYRDWRQDESTLDGYAVRFGPWKEVIPFYVFEPIDTEIEDGVDAFNIMGQWPKLVIHGVENKDKSYIGTFQKFADLPEEVRRVNEAFGPILAKYDYRSLFSTEVRITKDGDSYFIDPTCRAGSPPSQVMCEMVANLGEVIWRGANGELVEYDPAAKFGVQALVSIDRSEWAVMEVGEDLDQWFKLPYSCRIDGRTCIPPEDGGPSEIGWLLGIGDTMEEAFDHLKHNQELLPDGVHCEFASLADLLKEIKAAEEKGMEFTDGKVPDPAIILQD